MESKTNLKISMITKFDRYINESVGKKIGPLYHGSDTLFDKFEFRKLGKDNHPLSYLGYHFTPDINLAIGHFAKSPDFAVYEVEINVKSPLIEKESELVKAIIEFGYDNGFIDYNPRYVLSLPYFSVGDNSIMDSLIEGELSEIPLKKIVSAYKKYLINEGYDSIQYLNEVEVYDSDYGVNPRYDWIVFNSNQIKIINSYNALKDYEK